MRHQEKEKEKRKRERNNQNVFEIENNNLDEDDMVDEDQNHYLNVTGPPNTSNFVSSLRYFINRFFFFFLNFF